MVTNTMYDQRSKLTKKKELRNKLDGYIFG